MSRLDRIVRQHDHRALIDESPINKSTRVQGSNWHLKVAGCLLHRGQHEPNVRSRRGRRYRRSWFTIPIAGLFVWSGSSTDVADRHHLREQPGVPGAGRSTTARAFQGQGRVAQRRAVG